MSGRGRGPPGGGWRGDSYGGGRGPPRVGRYNDYRGPPRGGGGGGWRGRGGPPPRHREGRGGPPRRNPDMIVFRSYEEERDWVEDRRRKRKERKSKWDVLPTPEQAAADAQMTALQNFAATDFSGAAVDSGLPQQTRHARRLYLGNLPHNVTEQELHDFFEHAIQETSPTPITQDPILSVYINQERRFCFLEFRTVEMTTACLQLDGINVNGKGKLHIKRPNDYNPLMAPKVAVVPQLDVAKLGIVGKTVTDGPNKIFVGGLHYHLTEDQVLELLQAFGPVKAFHLVTNDPSGLNSKGYCFVEYVDHAHTQIAIAGLNGMDLGGGKVLTARVADATRDVDPTAQQAQYAVNMVGGYNVEELLDIAMGIQPGTGGGGAGGMMANPVVAMPSTAAPAATPLEIANKALEAAFSLVAAPQQPPPTRILVLSNMVTDEDLQTEEDHQALVEEVRLECAKFGTLTSMQIPRVPNGNVKPSAIRKVFLEYASTNDAQAANRELAGRAFGESVVQVRKIRLHAVVL